MKSSIAHGPSKLPQTDETIFTKMSALAQQHGALNMSQGFPDFQPPRLLQQAVSEAMKNGHNQYAPMAGNHALRDWIARDTFQRTGQSYDSTSEITIGAGASSLIFAAIQALVHPGDEVMVMTPCYDLYPPAIELAGGRTVCVPLSTEDDHLNFSGIQAALTSRTRIIIVNIPNNPTGATWTRAELEQLHEAVGKSQAFILSDEVYGPIHYDGREALSIAHHPELASRSLVFGSFGKILHATGWKIGYILGPEDLMKEIRKVHQYDVFSTGAPIQQGISDFLNGPEGSLHLAGLARFYQSKRDRLLDAITGSPWRFTPAESGYFQLLEYGAFERRDDLVVTEEWCKLGPDRGLALIPLSPFYPGKTSPQRPFRVRICFAKNDNTIDEGAKRLLHLSSR